MMITVSFSVSSQFSCVVSVTEYFVAGYLTTFFLLLKFQIVYLLYHSKFRSRRGKNTSAFDVTARLEAQVFSTFPIYSTVFFTVVIFTLTTCTEAFRRLNWLEKS